MEGVGERESKREKESENKRSQRSNGLNGQSILLTSSMMNGRGQTGVDGSDHRGVRCRRRCGAAELCEAERQPAAREAGEGQGRRR